MDTVLQRHGWGCGKPGNASYQGIRKCANHLHRWKYLKIPTRIHNDMGPLATELLQGYRLARLVGKACPRMRITKEMIQTIAQQYTQKIKHNLTIACGRELL